MNDDKLRWWVYGLIVLGSIYFIEMDRQWEPNKFGCDFRVYYDAANGYYHDNWTYKDFTRYAFKPFTYLEYSKALSLWNGLSVLSYLILSHYMMKVKYGAILSVAFFRVFAWSLVSGNITPILCILAIFPSASLLAIFFKPYFSLFTIIHTIKASPQYRHAGNGNKEGPTDIYSAAILHTEEG